MHYIIIGNGGAGVSALQAIRIVDKKSHVTILSREKYPSYSPCSLPSILSEEIDKLKILRFEKDFYQRLNTTFLKNTTVLQIFPKQKKILLSNKKTLVYDKLLIAAGATPITIKNLPGVTLDGVHVMGTLDSALGILAQCKQGVHHAVVIGGGFIGIETAVMLKKRGIDVTLVEALPHVLLRMVDSDIAEKIEYILRKNGITLHLNDTLKSINGKHKVSSVSLKNKTVNCDMVVVAIGMKPNIEILRGSKIAVQKGILVDSTMQTNMKDIYSAGDIAEVHEQITGLYGSFAIWPNAIEQGRIAGLNMANTRMTYAGAEMVNVLDVFSTPIIAMGYTSHDITGSCEVITRSTPDTMKKIIVKDNRIVGLQFVGTIRNTGTFYSLMKNASDVSEVKERLLDDNFLVAPPQQ